ITAMCSLVSSPAVSASMMKAVMPRVLAGGSVLTKVR
ncbi:MAG: hypothetical protein JWR60_3164, partial [Polaromonas sp.]|nr:hypothetical protein [Polaromonas sp.]